MFKVDKSYSCKPGIVSNKSRSRSGKSSPPQSSDSMLFDALAKQGSPTGTLGLESRLERIDGSEDHAESSGT